MQSPRYSKIGSRVKYGIMALVIACTGIPQVNAGATLPANQVIAQEARMTHGAEFQFTNRVLRRQGGMMRPAAKGPERRAARAMRKAMYAACAASSECKVESVKGRWGREWKVTFNDGWFFKISWDPRVVEVITAPQTLDELKVHGARGARMEKYIFDIAAKVDLQPENGSGHYNLGFKTAFKDDPELFMRYFADYSNHPDLALGGIGKDPNNAPPLALLKQDQRDALIEVIGKFKDGAYKTASEVSLALQNRIYYATLIYDDPIHYQALGMKSINGYPDPTAPEYDPPAPDDQKHVEVRGVFNQSHPEHFTLMASLQEARVHFLAKQKGPIIYIDKPVKEFTDGELYSRFYAYVSEMGLDFEQYRPLFSAYHLWKVELDAFISGQVDWSNPEHVELMESWALDAPISAFVREKFKIAFKRAASAPHQHVERVLKALHGAGDRAGQSQTANAIAARQVLGELRVELSKIEPTIDQAPPKKERSVFNKLMSFCKLNLDI